MQEPHYTVTPEQILDKAGSCVKCGLCLSHCPTYRETANEAESPRGRIALIQGLLNGALEDSSRLRGHLDRCLECRACEPACPSLVEYATILDGARAWRFERLPPARRWAKRMTLDLFSDPQRLDRARRLFRWYDWSGLRALLWRGGLLRRLRLEIPDRVGGTLAAPTGFRDLYPPAGPERGTVALFTGCVSTLVEAETLHSARRLLNRLGFRVMVPPEQCCCGAIHRHAGDPDSATRRLDRNADAFRAADSEALVSVASACVAELRQHPDLEGKVFELDSFLTRVSWPARLRLQPLERRVAVHEPCTLRNLLRDPGPTYALLGRIPGLEAIPLPGNRFCCGAAGTYMLTQRRMSQRLLEAKIAALQALDPDILVTTNTGCALQLAAGIRQAGLAIELLHPVQLLERQLADD